MNRKEIEKTPPILAKCKNGKRVSAQIVGKTLVLNRYEHSQLIARHCIQTNGKYETYYADSNQWLGYNIVSAFGYDRWYTSRDLARNFDLRYRDVPLIKDWLDKVDHRRDIAWDPDERAQIYHEIEQMEYDANRTAREKAEERRIQRVKDKMATIPIVSKRIDKWIDKTAWNSMNFAIKDPDTGLFSCSQCGHESPRAEFGKGTTGDMVKCPNCHRKVMIMPRRKSIDERTRFAVLEPVNDKYSVMRYFRAERIIKPAKKKEIHLSEDIRVLLNKQPNDYGCEIYYYQDWTDEPVPAKPNPAFFDRHNPMNMRMGYCYLYDGGIAESLENTIYEPWSRLFTEWSAAGLKLQYNCMMCGCRNSGYVGMMEMLYRGRFNKLLYEQSDRISPWDAHYYGHLHPDTSKTIEEVFGLSDKQRINRLRDLDGDSNTLLWLQYEDSHHQKISQKTLKWLLDNQVYPYDLNWMKVRFTPEQIMNYVTRQQAESYPGMTVHSVISQYEDYMDMCKKLKKDTSDPMVYRPKELKRRHNEAVLEIEANNARLEAEEWSRKYPEVEKVLKEIKPKLEYKNDDYEIIVPQKTVDIVLEGRYLHHCVASSDRYFDRIKSHETYICFLRKVKEPDTPFYTIEVEPDGTIRQHRGAMDEEPELDKVKPFLRDWQQAIKKRMKAEDKAHAKLSAIKREENIEELKRTNNTRVLKGLMEDFMAAV